MKLLRVCIDDERKAAEQERLFANRRPHLHPVSPELDTAGPSRPTVDSATARIYGLYLVIYNTNLATLRAVLSQPRTSYQGSLFMVPSSCSGNAESLWRGHLVCARPGLKNPIQDRAERQEKPSVEVFFTRRGPCVSVCAPILSVTTVNLDFALSHMSLMRSKVVIPLRDVS
jgi:hypothetical protein